MIDLAITAWAAEHWWLAFWLGMFALGFAYGIVIGAMFTMRRLLRALVVLTRGWPPAHLDAYGDWAKEPEHGPMLSETATIGDDGSRRVHRTFAEPKEAS